MTNEAAADKQISPHVVVHAMREAHRRAARLLSFGASVMYAEHSAVFEEQAVLAIDDIVSFALHVRRAIDLLDARSHFKSLPLVVGNSPVAKHYLNDATMNSDIDFLELLGRIVHSNRLGISPTEAETARTIQGRRSVLGPRDLYPHHFWVKSDRRDMYMICIESFVLTYVNEVEPRLDTLCWEAGFVSPNEEHCHLPKPKPARPGSTPT